MSEIGGNVRQEIEMAVADLQALMVGIEVRCMDEILDILTRSIKRLEEARRILYPEIFREEEVDG